MSLSDVLNNIRFLRYRICFELTNPWDKEETEEKFKECGVKYLRGYNDIEHATTYAVIGGKKENLKKFCKWFTGDKGYEYYFSEFPLPIIRPKIVTIIK